MEKTEGRCFHCGEPIPGGVSIHVTVDGREQAVCCAGCQAVAQLIFGTGLGRYYQFRQELGRKAEEDLQGEIEAWQGCDDREPLWPSECRHAIRHMRHEQSVVHLLEITRHDLVLKSTRQGEDSLRIRDQFSVRLN